MLTIEQIKELVKERPNSKFFRAGKGHQDRLKLHSEVVLTKANLSPAYTELRNWLGGKMPELLPADKFERWEQLCTTPLPTISLTDDIFTYLYRVFEAQDAFCRYEFNKPDLLDDWEEFRDGGFWKTAGFSALRMAIDSVWVVELPEEQEGDYPEPKDKLIDISCVIDIDNDNRNNCRHLLFALNDRLYVYDDEFIRVFEYKDEKVGRVIVETAHGLGYCPARMFWSEKLTPGNNINKKSPITPVLGDLDWLLVLKVFKKYMDMSNAYPIIAAYESNDDFTETPREDNDGRATGEKSLSNPFIGPGTLWTVKPPVQGEPDIMSNPIKLISPDVATLQHHVDEDVRLSTEIFRKVTGNGGEAFNETAKNEKQITSGFESQMIVLRRVAANFEVIQKFADEVKAKIRYGSDAVLNVAVDYGSRFFLRSVEELTEGISMNREKGIDDGLTDAMTEELLETRFRNDKRGLLRVQIIRELDPLPDKTIEEALTIFEKGGIDKINLLIKIHKLNFVKRFEREQLPLQFFAEGKDFEFKIKSIRDEFVKYAQEMIPAEELAAMQGGDQSVQDTALNGAQVSSFIEVVSNVNSGILPKESAKAIIKQAFPAFDDIAINRIIDPLDTEEETGEQPKQRDAEAEEAPEVEE